MKKFTFKIDHIDPLGQGVSKESEKVAFIPKALPGEEGIAQVISEKKGVMFGALLEEHLQKKSPERIPSACPHYYQCGGCHYLHTSYENEVKYKLQSLEWLTKKLPAKIFTHPARERFSYRNRLQLHYDSRQNKLGFRLPNSTEILEIPDCLLPRPEVQAKLRELYHQEQWKQLLKGVRPSGHIEIYSKNGQMQISVDRPYADGGFTQVNEAMNQVLVGLVHQFATPSNPDSMLLDLFGGGGNLSFGLKYKRILVVDSYPHELSPSDNQEFLNLNLYKDNLLKKLEQTSSLPVETVIIDPPRSGWKELSVTLKQLRPKKVIYVSCNPATLVRDISSATELIKNLEFHLVDLFPGTYHYEVLATFELE